MKEKITKIRLKLPDSEKTQQWLINRYPGYKIKYKKFPDIWEIRNKQFKHSIWYYPEKDSLVKTTLSKEYNELIILNIVLFILTGVFIVFNEKFSWINNYNLIFFTWLIIIPLSNIFIWTIRPKYRKMFNEEHKNIVQKISEINSLT